MHPKARLLATTGVEKDVGSRGKINTQERQSREQIPEVTTSKLWTSDSANPLQ